MPTVSSLGVKVKTRSPPTNAFPFPGGETAALERLRNYLWGTDAVATYKETRNGLLGNESNGSYRWVDNGASPLVSVSCYSVDTYIFLS